MSESIRFKTGKVSYDTTFEAEVTEGLYARIGACIDHGDNVNRCDIIEIKLPSGEMQSLDEPIIVYNTDIIDRAVTEYQRDCRESRAADRYDDWLYWRDNR